jgi:L-methionine (R)-S-oxide reductase
MSETLNLPETKDRRARYEAILPQWQALIADEADLIANLANTAAVLREAFGFFWVGFYLVKETELVLGPFQGPIACTRIAFHRGVCGAAYTKGETLVVPNVDEFPGHIACSSAARSEIVVPVRNAEGKIMGVLDVDSDQPNDFSGVDAHYLEKMMNHLAERKLFKLAP